LKGSEKFAGRQHLLGASRSTYLKENPLKQLRERLTYANVMSTIAVFLVLGGGAAFAAGQLAKNSVGSKQLKNNAVTTAKIKKGAVTGAKVKPGSLKASNFAAGQLPAGSTGPKGDRGEPGPSFGAYGYGDCGPLEESFEVCASTGPVNLPASGPVLLIASAEWDNDDSSSPPDQGQCRFSVDGSDLPPEVAFGEATTTHGVNQGGSISMNRITEPLSAGTHTFDLECSETKGTVYNDEAMLSAVLLGSASVQEQKVLPLP
jgi:hypothetical protein